MGGTTIQSTPQPDPMATAQAQSVMNRQTAVTQTGLNAIDQWTPDGNLHYGVSEMWPDGTPHFVAATTLSPSGQEKLDLSNAIQTGLGRLGVSQIGKVSDLLGSPADYGQGAIDARTGGMAGLPQIGAVGARYSDPNAPDAHAIDQTAPQARYADPTAPNAWYADTSGPSARYTDPNALRADPSLGHLADRYETSNVAPDARYAPGATLVDRQNIASNQALEGGLIALGRRRLDPILAQTRDNLQSELANKGLKEGSEGYDRAMAREAQGENDAHDQLILTGQQQAFDQAATRANTAFGQDLSRTGQAFNQGLAQVQNDFGQDMVRANYGKDVNEQNLQNQLSASREKFAQEQGAAQFGLAANQANFGQDLSQASYGQGAAQQNFAQDLARAGYTRDTNTANFAQDMARAGYTQGAAQQNFDQDMSRAGYGRDTNQANFQQDLANDAQRYGQQQTRYGDQMTQRQEALDEIGNERNAGLNDIIGLLSGTQVNQPKFVQTPNTSVQPVDYTGLVSSLYNSSVQQNNGINQANATASAGMWSGIGSIFGGLGGLFRSDERLKEDVTPLGHDPETGDVIAAYKYKPEAGMGGLVHLGLMAQDVEQRDPGAVVDLPDGTKAVDYGRAVGRHGGRRPGGLSALGANARKAA